MSNSPIFSKLFGPSPITPVQQHMATCEQCAAQLDGFFNAVFKEDWSAAEKKFDEIGALEDTADDLKKQIRMNLPRSLFLPVSRNNLLDLLQVQDRIANTAKDVAGLVLGRKMTFPESFQTAFRELINANIRAVKLARQVMDELNDLVVTGFSGHEIELVEKILEELDAAEHQSDVLEIEMRRMMFAQERESNPIDIMFKYQVIDRIGDVANDAQTVGNRMMYLIAN
jgi:predicted phosphate transport protein (TIGR00153 family)